METAEAKVPASIERKLLQVLGGSLLGIAETMGKLVILVRQTIFWLRSAERPNKDGSHSTAQHAAKLVSLSAAAARDEAVGARAIHVHAHSFALP